MTSTSSQGSSADILTRDYMELLQSLCTTCEPSVDDIIAAFKGFRRALDDKKPKAPSRALPTSSKGSRIRGGKSAARTSAPDDHAGCEEYEVVCRDVGFERSCSWEPEGKPCWIKSDLELWNRVLARNCIELKEVQWGELLLRGYHWPEHKAEPRDILHVSLLIHVLLRQHRCVRHVYFDMSETQLERYVIWHAIKTSAVGIRRLFFKHYFLDLRGLMSSVETVILCDAIASMTNLTVLCLSLMWFNGEVVRMIGGYVEHATALSKMELRDIEANDTDAGVFLDHLARNRSLKSIWAHECFLIAREGHALADVVQNHVTLEEIDVKGSQSFSPSALLKAVVHSKAIRCLAIHQCRIEAEDINALASALKLSPPPPGFGADIAPPQLRTRLQKLQFLDCQPAKGDLEAAYAKLIRGGLVHLTLSNCGLGDLFAMTAAYSLYFDTRLRELNVGSNKFSIGPLRSLIGALEVNKTLKALVLNMSAEHPPERLSTLFTMIRRINAFSRLRLQWVYPRAPDFSNSILAAHTLLAYVSLDVCGNDEATEYLDAIAGNPNLEMVQINCLSPKQPAMVQKLADTLASTKSLRSLMLNLTLPDADVVKLFRALECNRTILTLLLHYITFSKKTIQALGRLVANNRALILVTVDLRSSDPEADRTAQCRRICQELREALRRNCFMTSVNLFLGSGDHSNDPVIKQYFRRNIMLINQACRFALGSKEKTDALAFETLKHNTTLPLSLNVHLNVPQESAVKMVAEARRRLAFDYFVLVGVVKSKIVCHRNKKAKKRKTVFDNMGRDLQALIFSYLSLTDVVDV